jgi:hypothetical protein
MEGGGPVHRLLAGGAAAQPAGDAADLAVPGLRPGAGGQPAGPPGLAPGLATATVFAALIVGVVVFVVALGALLVDQVGGLVDAIPDYARQISDFLNDTLATELSGDKLAANLLGNPGAQDFVNGLAAAAVGLSTTLVGLILQGLTIGLFTFYLVADGPRLRRSPCSTSRSTPSGC